MTCILFLASANTEHNVLITTTPSDSCVIGANLKTPMSLEFSKYNILSNTSIFSLVDNLSHFNIAVLSGSSGKRVLWIDARDFNDNFPPSCRTGPLSAWTKSLMPGVSYALRPGGAGAGGDRLVSKIGLHSGGMGTRKYSASCLFPLSCPALSTPFSRHHARA